MKGFFAQRKGVMVSTEIISNIDPSPLPDFNKPMQEEEETDMMENTVNPALNNNVYRSQDVKPSQQVLRSKENADARLERDDMELIVQENFIAAGRSLGTGVQLSPQVEQTINEALERAPQFSTPSTAPEYFSANEDVLPTGLESEAAVYDSKTSASVSSTSPQVKSAASGAVTTDIDVAPDGKEIVNPENNLDIKA